MFKLASFGNGQLFTLVSPDLSVPGVSPKVLQRVISQAMTANVVMAGPFASPLFHRLAGRGALFRGSMADGFHTLRSL